MYTDVGIFHFFTKYSGKRVLYFETSKYGKIWTEDTKLAAIPEKSNGKSGHYQVSGVFNGHVVALFLTITPMGMWIKELTFTIFSLMILEIPGKLQKVLKLISGICPARENAKEGLFQKIFLKPCWA